MDFYENVKRIFADWNYGHPYILYGLIRSMKPDVAVEIGTYRGFGAAWMAKALQENNHGRLYCVDNFSLTDHETRYGDARIHLHNNLVKLGVRDWAEFIDGDSAEVHLPDKIDIAYIDGWHGYESVVNDFLKIVARGAECICLDDTTQSVGPRVLIEKLKRGELNGSMWQIMDVRRDCGMTILMRNSRLGPITYSQEIPMPNTGVDLTQLTREEQRKHFEETIICFHDIEPLLHPGKQPSI